MKSPRPSSPYTHCERCGEPCRVGPPPNPDARLLRRSLVPRGLCATCAAAAFIRSMDTLMTNLNEFGPRVLLIPHVQEGFARVMRSGFADAQPSEIDWPRMARQWALPFPKNRKGGRHV